MAPTENDIKEQQIRYTYDKDGNLSRVSYPVTKNGVQALSYVYDSNGCYTDHVSTRDGKEIATIALFNVHRLSDKGKRKNYLKIPNKEVMDIVKKGIYIEVKN